MMFMGKGCAKGSGPYGKGGGGGGAAAGGFAISRPGQNAGTLEQRETRFSQDVNTLFEQVVNMNIASANLNAMWQKLMSSRDGLLQAYGVAAPKGGGGGGGGGGCGKGGKGGKGVGARAVTKTVVAAGSDGPNFKQTLHEIASQSIGRPSQKGDITYEEADAESEGDGPAYVATCILSAELGGHQIPGEVCTSKKLAGQSAAKAALDTLFPGAAQKAGGRAVGGAGARAPKDPNRAPDPNKGIPSMEPQSRLRWALNLLLDRPVTREDVTFETVEEHGVFQSTCTLPAAVSDNAFTGEACENKKQADASAAQIALTAELEARCVSLAAAKSAKKTEKRTKELALKRG